MGATGNQGGALARHLLQRGNFKVRAFVHDSNKPAAQALKQAGAELVEGDLGALASLDRALQGASGVFSVQTFQDGLDAEIREGKALTDAAQAAGIQHFVYSSVGSAERNGTKIRRKVYSIGIADFCVFRQRVNGSRYSKQSDTDNKCSNDAEANKNLAVGRKSF